MGQVVLQRLQIIHTCSCGTNSQIVKFQEDKKLVQILIGLHESYINVRGAMLLIKSLMI